MTIEDQPTIVETPPPEAARAQVVSARTTHTETPTWSPAQIFGVIIGIGFVVLGIAAVARTGFDTSHVYTPHDLVWKLPHSPLLSVIEIGFGAFVLLASIVPGGVRPVLALMGAIALAFGIVVLVEAAPNRLNHWLAVTHRSGALFTAVGAVLLIAAIASPVFVGGTRSVMRDERVVR